jgi:GTPase SAR1 family protein
MGADCSYVNVHCFVVCFSVVDSITYKNIKERWIPELKVHTGRSNDCGGQT